MIQLDAKTTAMLRETEKSDSEFLANYGLMDYSMLLVIETVPAGSVKSTSRWSAITKSKEIGVPESQQVYHFGIIDYLQDWNLNKKIERFVLRLKKGDPNERSAVPPGIYQNRFAEFMIRSVFKNTNVDSDYTKEQFIASLLRGL